MARDYVADISGIIRTPWDTTETKALPQTDAIKLAGGARWVEATYLYADLANSSKMAKYFDRRITAKILKSFLQSATFLVGENGGKVISFDGDRILGVFTSNSKNTSAAKCALQINWVVSQAIRPTFEKNYDVVRNAKFRIEHGVGIDTGKTLVVRGGVRGNNDLISIGRAPNLAAKLSDLRGGFTSRITKDVFEQLHSSSKYGGGGNKLMWESANWSFLDENIQVYRSNWHWKP